ncbi:MAG: glycerol-3-phosphate dehydrogenase/oxidase [Candidatus Dormibacteraeota bacterium]|nr:glycerol-3-phosphate dehydrogenase/oxidase [Candidatus Dormibacteraeota bacterium]
MARPIEEALERLASETFDLIVIGAGVVGARVAYEAAKAGAAVALLDAGDFGGATSSASSKLIHGGLRYLQMHDVALVHEARRERRILMDRIAPHLVRPLQMVLPIYHNGPHGRATVAAALGTYAFLSGFHQSHTRMVGPGTAARLVPGIRVDGLRAAGVYEDAQTHDSRLVLATVTAADRAGAVVANHLPVTELDIARGRVCAVHSGDLRVRCRMVINAAGPWVDHVRRLEDPRAADLVRLSKGVHLVLDRPPGWRTALTTPLPEGRVAFAVPWQGMLLLGTTDTEFRADPADLRVDEADVSEVLSEAALGLSPELLARERIRYAFAGLRALPSGAGSTAQARREEVIAQGPAAMVSMAGGKLTTHRLIALHVLHRLPAFARTTLTDDPLPGSGPLPERPEGAEREVWEHLTGLYGQDAAAVFRRGPERIAPGGPDVWGQVLHAAAAEWARTVDDVVRRRTTLQVRGLDTPAVRAAIDATLARERVLL